MSAVPELTFYNAKVCPWGQRAALALAEAGAPHTLVEIDLQNKPSWYASTVNPASKVPVLRLGKHEDSSAPTIPESHVLLELVSDLYPGKLLPNDAVLRAEARYFNQRFNDIVSTPYFAVLLRGEAESIPKLYEGIKEIITLLNKHDGPFVLGESISIGDLGVGPFVQRIFATARAGLLADGVHEKLASDSDLKVFADYEKTLTSRESFKKTFDEEYVVGFTRKRVEASRAAAAK